MNQNAAGNKDDDDDRRYPQIHTVGPRSTTWYRRYLALSRDPR